MKTEDIIKQVAREHKTTKMEVEAEMRAAIREAMATEDPVAQKLWKRIAPDGKEPSIEEFLDFCNQLIKERRHGAI